MRRVGKLALNRNPDNFFAETEQVAFHVGNVVPGIDFTNDPLLQGAAVLLPRHAADPARRPQLRPAPDQPPAGAGAQQPARRLPPAPDPRRPGQLLSPTRSAAAARAGRDAGRAPIVHYTRAGRRRRRYASAAESFARPLQPGDAVLEQHEPVGDRSTSSPRTASSWARSCGEEIRQRVLERILANIDGRLTTSVATKRGPRRGRRRGERREDITGAQLGEPAVVGGHPQGGRARSRRRRGILPGDRACAAARRRGGRRDPRAARGRAHDGRRRPARGRQADRDDVVGALRRRLRRGRGGLGPGVARGRRGDPLRRRGVPACEACRRPRGRRPARRRGAAAGRAGRRVGRRRRWSCTRVW